MSTTTRLRWPLFLIAAPAAVAIWSGWVGLGQMCGFGLVRPFPGIVAWHLDTAITLPVGVECYGAYALGVWLHPGTPQQAQVFARRSALGSLALGMLGQVAYHLLAAAHATRAPWLVTVLVSCVPVAVLGLAATLTHLLRGRADAIAESHGMAFEATPAEAIPEAAGMPPPEAITEPPTEPPTEPAEVPLGEAPGMPEPEPPQKPASHAARPSQDPEAKKARDAYRRSVRASAPLSDRALGEMFGRSRTWGASRIREADSGPKLTGTG